MRPLRYTVEVVAKSGGGYKVEGATLEQCLAALIDATRHTTRNQIVRIEARP